MTEKLYWSDAYMREFEATVEAIDANRLVLDRSAFCPRGGGLVSDTGMIEGVKVLEVLKEGEKIIHMLSQPIGPTANGKVQGAIDWDRRHRIMRMHTAAHILSSVVNRETGALITGNQISPQESRVDFNLGEFDKEKMASYLEQVNEAVSRNIAVESFFMKREEALAVPGFVKLANAMPPALEVLRIVKIGDVDTQADGGVHVKNTAEIGTVVGLRTENKGKNNRRLYFTVE